MEGILNQSDVAVAQNDNGSELNQNCKIKALIDYLYELTRINFKVISNLESYPDDYKKVFWLSSVPKEPGCCFVKARDVGDDIGDTWLEVKKWPKEPQLPKIPDSCVHWVDIEPLRNTKEIPELKKSIVVESNETLSSGESKSTCKTYLLSDSPHVKRDWEIYLENQWLPWTELYDRYVTVQNVYSELFLLYQELQKLGEQYELVLCLGLLRWKTPSGDIVKRHLITAKASLEFEPRIGRFCITPSDIVEQPNVELDMLDPEFQPSNAKQLTHEGRQTLGADPWERSVVDPLLNAIANSLADGGQGEYRGDQFEASSELPSHKPIVEFAPALVLRKRSMRGMQYMLERIKEQVENLSTIPQIPHAFLDLCESLGRLHKTEPDIDGQGKATFEGDEEIFFPRPANEAQKRIVLALNRQSGVLVQGPPGTGKSNTIANLICHLLANGKRILVTAKTSRALKVLAGMLPVQISPLCVSLLGDTIEERESLDESVKGMLAQVDRRDDLNIQQQILKFQKQLYENRKNKAEIENKLLAARERETFMHAIPGTKFQGTAGQIAQQLQGQEATFAWLIDNISPQMDCPLMDEEIMEMRKAINEIDTEMETTLTLTLPDPSTDIPSPTELCDLFQNEQVAKKTFSAGFGNGDDPNIPVLLPIPETILKELIFCLEQVLATLENIDRQRLDWATDAVFDILTDKDKLWRELLNLSKENTLGLSKLASYVDSLQIEIPSDIDQKRLLSDALIISAHLQRGGRLKVAFMFIPKLIKNHGGFITKVKIDGLDCSNTAVLQSLIDFLTLKHKLEYIDSLWPRKLKEVEILRTPLQVTRIEHWNETLSNIFKLRELKDKAATICSKIGGLQAPHWQTAPSVKKLIDTCSRTLLKKHLLSVQANIDKVRQHVALLASDKNTHPITEQLLKHIDERDLPAYKKEIENILDMREKASLFQRKSEFLVKLRLSAPQLAADLQNYTDPNTWSERLASLPEAWDWRKARSWLEEFVKDDDIDKLDETRKCLEKEIQTELTSLASIKAWSSCFDRMKEEHRRHLIAWQQSMNKYGKGTGKHAYKHRQNAQEHLNKCRDAVPAWVMPLHRVYDTVEPAPGIFDVVIVDEASQCGPEALPLLYLGKQIIIVGDDKQISPQGIGIARDQLQRLMRDYLVGFTHNDSFDIENSLFDHASIRFGNRITLREHFRCMPEIIEFSNDLWYKADPLIPLRQFSPDRLEPLKHVYVPSGFREGQSSRVINRPEAEELVKTIVACCRQPQYALATMGVIILQGEAQAHIIEKMLLEQLGAEEIEHRRLQCGDPYTFQGDERDVIFLSMVAAPNERIGPLTQMADQRRFNVAASRAKDQMWLFHSATTNELSEHCLRHRLLRYFQDPRSTISLSLGENAEELRQLAHSANRMREKPPKPFDSWFEVDVALDIAGHGYKVIPQFEIAGKRIDLVVQWQNSQIAIECDGEYWHGAEEYAKDVERQRMLERCNCRFFRIRESNYKFAKDKELNRLWKALYDRGIFPVTQKAGVNDSSIDRTLDNQANLEHAENNSDEENDDDLLESHQYHEPLVQDRSAPTNTEEAINAKPDLVSRAIIDILTNRPNNSCIRAKMPTYLLKRWNIRTRSQPRQQFEKKVDHIIFAMARKGDLIIYQSVNERIKLS